MQTNVSLFGRPHAGRSVRGSLAALAFILLAQCADQPPPASHASVSSTSQELTGESVQGEPAPIVAKATVDWPSAPESGVADGPSPVLTTNFQALAYNGDYLPEGSGAVGPSHIVVVANGTVKVTNRTGAQTSSVTLDSFWSGTFGLNSGSVHPRVTYDPYGGRFVIAARGDHSVTTDDGMGGTNTDYTYYLMLAVSKTSDPTEGWYQYQVLADDGSYDPNFTVLGFNKNWVAAGMSLTTGFCFGFCITTRNGTPLWVFNKAAIYANAVTTPTKLSRNDGYHYQLVPATTLDASIDQLYVMQDNSDSGGTLRVLQIAGAIGSESLSIVGTSSSGTAWAGSSSNGNEWVPNGLGFLPQQGSTTKIAAGDARLNNVIYRGGSLWTAQTVFLPTGTPTHTSVQWWQVNPTTGAKVQSGMIDDPTGVTSYAYPAIAVNSDNNVLVGFSRFSATQYPTAAYAFRQSTDAAGTMRTDAVLKAGSGSFTRSEIFQQVNWGTYSTALVDPADDSTLWTMQQYASGSNGWGLWWGKVHPTIPVLASPGNKTLAEMETLTFTLSATDADNDPITFSSPNLPIGATLTAAGVFSWTPSYIQQGTYNVTLTATDSTLLSDSKTIQIVVTNVYDPPVLTSIGTKNGTENALLQFTVNATDPQGRALVYSTSGLPAGASFDTFTHVFAWTPGYTQSGTYNVTFTVADNIPLSTSETVAIIIANNNRPPSLSPIGDRSSPEGTNISFTAVGSDPDGETLTYSATGLPPGATLNSATGAFSWTPTFAQSGVYPTVFAVSDPGGLTAIWNVTFTITDLNRPPTLSSIGGRSTVEGVNVAFSLTASDPDGDTLTFSATGMPAGATLSQASGFSWTPDYSQSGSYSITFTVSDPGGLTSSEVVSITVGNINRPPVLGAIPTQNGAEGTLLTFGLPGSDPDSDTITYSAQGMPPGATLDVSTGQFAWTPGYSNSGMYSVTFKVTDSGSLTATQQVTLVIDNTNRAPVFDPMGPQQVTEHQSLTVAVTATDPDGQAVTLSVVGLPSGAQFNANTGAFAWSPATGQAGVYNVTFKATDSEGLTASAQVSITVIGSNLPPVIAPIAPITIPAGRLLTFTALATDPNADQLVFTGQRLPTGASLDSSSGTFTWQTEREQVGSYSVTIVVTDPSGLNDSVTVGITLVTNQAPVLANIPPIFGAEGSPLSYTVLATDPNGDPLTYSVSTLPTGATFDAGTHTLRWTPTFDQAGVYDVTFTVTDSLDPVSTSTTITIANTNRAPVLGTIGPRTVTEGALLIFGLNAADADGDDVILSATSVPEGGVFDPTTHVFRWRPSYQQAGVYYVTFAATDIPGASSSETVTITVLNANGPPTIDALGTEFGVEGLPLTFTASGSDPDNDSITFTASNLPPGASFDSSSQSFAWTPGYTQAGNYNVTLKATDSGGLFSTLVVGIVIVNSDRAPILDPIGPHAGAETAPMSFSVHANDPDGDTVTLKAASLPDGATFSAASGTFAWTPGYGQAGTYTVSFSATAGTLTTTEDVTITIAHTNRGPTLSPVGTQNGEEGVLLAFTLIASDPDGDAITYTATGLPAGATLDSVTGQFTWTPGFASAGTYPVTWRATDTSGLTSSVGAPIIIANTDRAPVIDPIDSQQINERDSISFAVTASDPDGDTVTLSALALPAGASFDTATGLFAWSPAYGQAGIYTLTFKATDPSGVSGSIRVTVTVIGTNGGPLLNEISPITLAAGRTVSFLALASDPNNDTLTFTAQRLPPGASLDAETGAFLWPTTTTQLGTFGVTITATDPGGLSDSTVVSITLVPNHPPVFDPIPPQTGVERQAITFQVFATDQEGDQLTYNAMGLPFGSNFDRSSRSFRWIPSFDQAGDYEVTFSATDGLETTTTTASIIVGNTNRKPSIVPVGAHLGTENNLLTFTIQGTDPDNDRLSFSAAGLPSGALLNASTHVFGWTPTFDQSGDYDVTFIVTDPDGLTDSEDVTISIANTNRPPVLDTVAQQMGIENERLTFTVTGADPDGDELTYEATTLPAGATFDPSSQTFAWTPGFDQAGTYTVVLKVTDEAGLSASRTATVIIENVNRPPAFDPLAAQQGPEGMLLTFAVHATDPDANVLTYGLELGPPGTTIDPTTGVVTWTPGFADAGSHDVIVTAIDGLGGSATATVTVVISNVRRPPTLTPIGARLGSEANPLTFIVLASDPDGGVLTYTAQDLPGGATLAPGTGAFAWTPGYAQAGSYTSLFTVKNDAALSVSELVTITITDTDRAPIVPPITDKIGVVKTAMQFTATGSDPDGDTLTWFATGLPEGASFDVLTQAFAWTPTNGQTGAFMVTVSATDGTLTTSVVAHLSVSSGTNPPVLDFPASAAIAAGRQLAFVVTASDLDGDVVTIEANGLPTTASFDRLSGTVAWTPTATDIGTHDVTFTATDATGLTATGTTRIIVVKSTVAAGCHCGPGGDASVLLLLGLVVLTRRRRVSRLA